MKFNKLLSIGIVSLAAFASNQASALIMSVDFQTKSGWMADGINSTTINNSTNTISTCKAGALNASNTCGLTFSGAVAGLTNGYSTVNWGTSTSKSGLDILSKSGTLITNGGWVQTGLITHRNKTIPTGNKTLRTLDLATVFAMVNPPIGAGYATVAIKFTETPNFSDPKKCPHPQVSNVGCDDTFTVKLDLPSIIFKDFSNQMYKISFKLNPLSGVTSIVNNDGTITLVTAESSNNQIELLARLESIPAPATIGMLGLALIMLTFRRKSSAV